MKVIIDYLDEFERGAKALRKKYSSFESDYDTFLNELEANPFSGESLGQHTYKNRMAIASKGKGKRGGARVITYNLQQQGDDEIIITLMTIYDKSDIDNVSDAYIRDLVQQIETPKKWYIRGLALMIAGAQKVPMKLEDIIEDAERYKERCAMLLALNSSENHIS